MLKRGVWFNDPKSGWATHIAGRKGDGQKSDSKASITYNPARVRKDKLS